MSEKISKISVDGVVYDIASTGGGEVPGDIQEQLSALENKVTEEASAREGGDAKLSEKIESEASRVDGMVNQINENVASSIETLNNNLVQAIETINNGIAAEVTNREGGDTKLSEKIESEASRVDGMVNQINENVASSIETLNNNLVQAIETINNGIAAEVTNREEGDAKLQAAIDELAEKVNGEGADLTELEGKIEKNAADIATVNNNLVEAVNNINKNVADGFSTINGGLNNEIRPELEKAVKYEDTATEQNPGRKTIFLNNHDNICGKTTDGSAVNIAMVSKWNKVDLGSSSVEINLNGSAERPTYNDSKQIALLEDVHGNMETIALVKKDDLTYELQVGDKIAGTINIPADQFLKSVEYSAEDKSLTFVFNTSEGEQTSVVDLSSLVDTYVAGNGIELIENGFSIKLDPSSESYLSVSEAGIKVEGINEIKKNVQEVAANLVTVNENLASSIDAINKKAVKYEDVADSNLPERKAIVLKNGDVILGGNLEGGTSSLVQLNRWGVADFGSSSVPFNINTPKDVRPTVQEAGQSGEEAHKIAYLSDVESSSAQIEEVKAALETKADKIAVDAITEKVDGISADLEGVVKYQEFGEGRKTIQLSNYDNISGIDTKGEGHNLVMLSKWDKADFGAPGVELNLNGSADRPTYNDTKEIALTEDIEAAKEGLISYKVLEDGSKTIELANGDSLRGVNAEGVAGFNLAKVTPENKVEIGSAGMDLNLVGSEPRPLFNGSKGIALSEDLETKAAELQDNINLKASQSDLEAYMSATDTKVSELEEKIGNVPTKVSELENDLGFQNEAQVDGKIKEAIAAIPPVDLTPYATKEEIEGQVKYKDIPSEQLPNCKAVELAKGDMLLGGGNNLVQLNRWGIVDLGTPVSPINMNTPKDVRPTVQEAGQLGEEAHKIAYLEDVAGLSNTLEALNATVQILQSKVDVLTKTNTEVVSVDGSAGELKDSSKDYIVSGSINENAEIVGKSISLKSIKVSDNARLKLNTGDVEAKDLNISGSFPKANGNTVISVNNAKFIVFKDMVFDASEVYNGIEIGLASNSVLPKNILFDNCKFQGEFSNNAILVLGTQDNAIITLNNCYFEKISNALRLSNKSNASGVVVNINNCTVDQWETRAPWQGFLICEDYTNKTEEEVNANNLFGDGKITVNFNNLVHAGVKINPADPASVCGTKNESQVVMVCQDAVAGPEGDYCLSYDAAKFPVVSFK